MTQPTLAQPLANPQAIATRYSTGLSANALSERLDTLDAAGHQWMPADMKVAVASSPTSDNAMTTIADSIKDHLSKTWDGFTEAFDDPVLHKQPTTSLALSRLLHASLGPIPVEQTDLVGIQKSLQGVGFGKGLPTDGVWGADWNSAYSAYSSQVINRQLAGDRPGSVSTASVGHHIWDNFEPSRIINQLAGYARSLPGDARDLAANVVGSAVNTLSGHETSSSEGVNSPGAKTAQEIESLLGNPHAKQKVAQEVAHPNASLLQDAGMVLTLVPIVGQGARATQVAMSVLAEGAAKDAAERGPGLIAQSLFGGLKSDAEGNLPTASARVALRRGPLNAKVFTNIPLLRQVGPVVGHLADEDGAYYRARTLLATPYKYGAVQVAGDLGQRGMLVGGGLGVSAQASRAIAGPNDLTNDIQNTDATDLIDRNLNRIIGTPFEHPFTDAVNLLGFVLHGPLGDTSNSTRVGDTVQTFTDTYGAALGKVGLHGIYQRAVQEVYGGKLRSVEDLAKDFGGQDYLDRFIALKTADLAAAHYAQKTAQAEGLSFGTDAAAYRQRVGALADEIWADPASHIGAARELMAQSGGVGLQNRFMADMVKGTATEHASDGVKWMQSGDRLTNIIRGGDAKYLFGAQGRTVISDAQDDFDHGLGQSGTTFTSTTRRQYTSEVSMLMGRLRSGINAATKQAARNVVDSQSKLDDAKAALSEMKPTDDGFTDARALVQRHQGRVNEAKRLQRRIPEALQSDLSYRMDDVLRRLSGPRGSDAEWLKISSDYKRLRTLVDKAMPAGQKFNLNDALEQGVDPDVLFTRMYGAPRPSEEDIGGGDWLRRHVPHQGGALGLGRLDTKSAQAAHSDLNSLEAELTGADDPEKAVAAVEALKNYGHDQFGLDERTLGVFDRNPDALVQRLRERASELASDVFLAPDAPQTLADEIKAMNALGYKPMLGSHIGHIWDGSLPPLGDVDGAISRSRRIAGAIGADPTQVTSRDAGINARIRVLNEMQHAEGVKWPARTTAETAMAVLEDQNLLTPKVHLPEHVAYAISRPLHKAAIEQVAKSKAVSLAEAGKLHEEEMARALQVRDIPRRQALKALTTPGEMSNGAQWAGMDPRSAALLWRAAQRGYAGRPTYIMGLQRIEDFARAGMGFGDKLAVKYPDSGAIQAMANLPNELVMLRNRARFTLSPFFDLRRVSKTNFKMGLDGVVPALNPLRHMLDNGSFEKASEYLGKLRGETDTASFDEADRYLHSQSVWGGYNGRHFEAYYAWEKKAQGFSDDEIRQGLHKVFEYGSIRNEGRSALERSVNAIFFPFSFEKTLIRNTGMYLLDHPQQALLLSAAMDGYNKANAHGDITDWVQGHLPILHDMEKLNAFSHGISPGEPGGINKPLLNLFLPQVWSKQSFTRKNLERSLPIWSDFGTLMADVHQQGLVGYNTARNGIDYAVSLGAPRSPFDPYRPMEDERAQRQDAEKMRNGFITALTPVLSANYHASPGTQITWPDSPLLPPKIQGRPVDRTTISLLVQRWYPAYDPEFGAQYAQKQAADADSAIAALRSKNPAKAQEYQVLVNLANSFSTKMTHNEYDTPAAADITAKFRQISVAASESDPQFYAFYNQHFAWLFGHLEQIQGIPG